MRKLNKKEGVAVFAAIAVVAYLLYGGSLLDLFNLNSTSADDMSTSTPLIETGFKTEDLVAGTGEPVTPGDTLTVQYVGSLQNGQVFDSSIERNLPFDFILGAGQVIRGWDEGFVGMRVGGKRRIIIAPDYGYGGQRVGPIPPNSVLIFEVELLKAEKK